MGLKGILFTYLCFISFIYCSQITDFLNNQTFKFPTFWHIKTKEATQTTFLLFPLTPNIKQLDTCKPVDPHPYGPNISFAGNAVISLGISGCDLAQHVKVAQDAGASVVIVGAGISFATVQIKNDFSKITIPVFIIGISDTRKILQIIGSNSGSGKPTILNLEKENNVWLNIAQGGFWIFLEVVVLLSYLINFVLGITSLVLNIKKDGIKPSFSQVSTVINLGGTFIFSLIVIDPWGVRYIVSQGFILVTVSLFPPALLTSVLFLSFFFNEVLISKGFLKPQLSVLKFPFLIVCITFWACYISQAVYLGTYTTHPNIIKTITLMNVLFFSIAEIYFICVTVLILTRLKNYDSPVLRRIIPLVCIIEFGVILFIIASVMQAASSFNSYHEKEFIAIYTLFYISSVFIFTSQFVYFRKPQSSRESQSPKPLTSSNRMVQLN